MFDAGAPAQNFVCGPSCESEDVRMCPPGPVKFARHVTVCSLPGDTHRIHVTVEENGLSDAVTTSLPLACHDDKICVSK